MSDWFLVRTFDSKGKMPTEKSPNKLKSEVVDKDLDIDKNHRHRRQDALLLEISPASESKQDVKDASSMLESKTNGISERTIQSNPPAVSRGSYRQLECSHTIIMGKFMGEGFLDVGVDN
uniref:Uncharacterized protein n=1 Tax=Chenopodium quinoa TaxID=63459 RepID=A0A803NDU4_CHEQI